MKQSISSYQRLWSYCRVYKSKLLGSLASAAVFGIVAAMPTYLLKHTIDDIFLKKLNEKILPFVLLFMLFFFLKGILSYTTAYLMHWVCNKVVNDIRQDLFAKIIYFPISFYRQNPTGKIMSYFLNDIQMIQVAASSAIKNGVRSIFEAFFLVTFAFVQNWRLAMLLVLVAPLMALTIRTLAKMIKKASLNIQDEMGTIGSLLQQDVLGIREIKAFNGEKIEINRFENALARCFYFVMRNVHAEAMLPSLIEFIAMIGGGVAFYVAIQQVLTGSLTPGQLSSFVAAVLLAYAPLKRLMSVYAELRYGFSALERIFGLYELEPEKNDYTESNHPVSLHDAITFNKVSFAYPDYQVFNNVSFSIKKGECVGIVGASGAGKSTLCDLLMGFVQPSSGTIMFDDEDLSLISPKKIRDRISYVGQQPFLFNDTILENVVYATPHVTQEDVVVACKQAAADDFIQELSNGYQSLVGENGSSLSGGQKQRVTIARALLKNADIVIFDEATSALDKMAEDQIQSTINALKGSKTIIIISHRPSLLQVVDRTLLVHNGVVEEFVAHSTRRDHQIIL